MGRPRGRWQKRRPRLLAPYLRIARVMLAGAAAATLSGAVLPAVAQKSGGTLRIYNSTQPPSASIHEESTIATNMPFMAVFNNLLRFDPTKTRNGFDAIVPELAESWSWDATRTKLTLRLVSGVSWHDGKPFTAKDVQCTWHRLNGKVGSSRVDLQACKLEYSIVSPK